jgi:type IV pilus assembly protein PilB
LVEEIAMFAIHNQAIQDLLRKEPWLASGQLEQASAEAERRGCPFTDVLVEKGFCGKPALLGKIAEHLGHEFVAEVPRSLPNETLAEIPPGLAHRYGVIPIRRTGGRLDVLTRDPFDGQTIDDLSFVLEREVRLVVADPDRVDGLIRQHYGTPHAPPANLAGAEAARDNSEAKDGPSDDDLAAMAGQAPVIQFVNLVLDQAVREQASDIHFEPFEHEFKIRYRIDGVLYEMTPPAKSLALPITSRLKVLANLNIAERRLPQDGRIRLELAGRLVDLRVSTLPTQFGESVVLRVLDQSAVQLDLGQLGLPPEILQGVQDVIQRPNGIFIVTGPTGSGKTTTLYSALRAINSNERKLLTVEDPVEYEIDGLVQVPVNPAAGLTFATALRSFLRQDPDGIMVGEIRDFPTAQIAVQASLTGHVVFSTLHTNDAAGSITRLVDLGVEPFLVGAALEAVLAQRLVRRICPSCRQTYQPSKELLDQLGLAAEIVGDRHFSHGTGCAQCHETGYRGRLGIFEWLRVTEAIRDLIGQGAPTALIRQKAIGQGMRTLRDDGLRAVFDGETTIEEVIRCTS